MAETVFNLHPARALAECRSAPPSAAAATQTMRHVQVDGFDTVLVGAATTQLTNGVVVPGAPETSVTYAAPLPRDKSFTLHPAAASSRNTRK